MFGIRSREPWANWPAADDLTINFHGHVVNDIVRTPVVRGLHNRWTATVDVKRCPKLELVLPGRERIIRNGYLNRLAERMEHAIYRVISEQPAPQSLVFEHAQRAKELGFDIKLEENVLVKWAQMPADPDWHGYPERETAPTPRDAIIVTRNLNGNQTGMLERALTCEEEDLRNAGTDPGTGTRRRLFAETSAYKGFAWYDGTPTTTDLHVEIEVDGERSRVDPTDTTNRVADKVWVVLSVQRPDRTIQTIRLETDMGLSCDDGAREPDAAGLILSKSRESDRGAISYAVDRALFIATDTCGDGPPQQNAAFEAKLEIEMTTMLDGCDAALETAIRNALVNLPAVPGGTTVRMVAADGKAWDIRTTVPERSPEHHEAR